MPYEYGGKNELSFKGRKGVGDNKKKEKSKSSTDVGSVKV